MLNNFQNDLPLSTEKTNYKLIFTGVLIVLSIVVSALLVSYQVYNYRDKRVKLGNEVKQRERLDVEWRKLLLEQEAHGSIIEMANRSTTQLGMYPPQSNQVVTISPPSVN